MVEVEGGGERRRPEEGGDGLCVLAGEKKKDVERRDQRGPVYIHPPQHPGHTPGK